MEILKILQEQANDLYPEDLDFFETELATGEGYDAHYQQLCREQLARLRAWMAGPAEDIVKKEPEVPKGVIVPLGGLVPSSSAAEDLTPFQIFRRDVDAIRTQKTYKTQFKHYVQGSPVVDEAFLEANFSYFQPWEMNAVVSVKPLAEAFLEKYFGALDPDKIARYQLFSESFFMKHYSQMDADIVLNHGKNPWRKKENRSKQLDVFLRLKGVRI